MLKVAANSTLGYTSDQFLDGQGSVSPVCLLVIVYPFPNI